MALHLRAIHHLISPRLTVASVKASPWRVDAYLPDQLEIT
jgi:hypothetical protein